MKRIFLGFVVFVLVIGLVGCGKPDGSSREPQNLEQLAETVFGKDNIFIPLGLGWGTIVVNEPESIDDFFRKAYTCAEIFASSTEPDLLSHNEIKIRGGRVYGDIQYGSITVQREDAAISSVLDIEYADSSKKNRIKAAYEKYFSSISTEISSKTEIGSTSSISNKIPVPGERFYEMKMIAYAMFMDFDHFAVSGIVTVNVANQDIDMFMFRANTFSKLFAESDKKELTSLDTVNILIMQEEDNVGIIMIDRKAGSEITAQLGLTSKLDANQAEEYKAAYEKYFSDISAGIKQD